jgi:hypothetical protein
MLEFMAISIPLTLFDQQKLEFLVRKIPEALVKVEEKRDGKKKYYAFPQKDNHDFKIRCEADYYLNSTLPSFSSCKFEVIKSLNQRFDEHKIELKDPELIKSIMTSLSYNQDTKKLYSLERVYGLALNGNYQKHFRFGLNCRVEKCQLTFSTGSADN